MPPETKFRVLIERKMRKREGNSESRQATRVFLLATNRVDKSSSTRRFRLYTSWVPPSSLEAVVLPRRRVVLNIIRTY